MTTPGPLRASSPAVPGSTPETRGPLSTRAALTRPALTTLAVVSLLGAAGCAGADTSAMQTADTQTPAAPSSGTTGGSSEADTGSDAAGAAEPAGQSYTDGTYTQTGSYQSPAGPEDVGVTITLEADVVSGVEVEPMPDNPTTREYQGRFAGGVADAVVGKKLDELSVDKVAGSSLTSGGFNDAVGKIKSEAQL